MIKTYKYVDTIHCKLNEYVLAYFRTIQTDTSGYRNELYEPEFIPVVNRHRKVLKERFKKIYEHVAKLSTANRILFCENIIQSNQIEAICRGEFRPCAFEEHPSGIEGIIKALFIDLYDQVLDGKPFRETFHTSLRDHFNTFCEANENITLCPICGIGELKKSKDFTRDQYDHFFPKSLYPLSSVNFYNLVPCCMECNSLSVKADKDTIAVSQGKLFFPYDESHQGINLIVCVRKDTPLIEDIEWELIFSNPDNRNDEIESWKTLYSIEERYQGYIKARVKKWYECYYNIVRDTRQKNADIPSAKAAYMSFLDEDEKNGLSFIRKSSLQGLLSGSNIFQAEIQALEYV